MKTEDIISRLNEDWRQLLSIYPELTEDGKKQAKSAINEIISSLKSMRDEKEDFPDIDFRRDIANELSRDELIERICEMNESYQRMRKEWFDKVHIQSSPQSQPGRGAEEILKTHLNEYIKTVHATEMIRLVGLNILMSKPYIKHILKAMEEYRTQSEGKDMYPKAFVEWILKLLDEPYRNIEDVFKQWSTIVNK